MARAKKGTKPKVNGGDPKSSCPCSNEPNDTVYIQCDSCDQWWHCCCVSLGGLLDHMVEVIENWECPRCFKSPYVGMDTDASVDIVSAENSSVRDIVKTEIKSVIGELKNIVETTTEAALENIKKDIIEQSAKKVKSYVEVVKTDLQEVVREKPSTQIVKQVVTQIDADNLQRVKRECNVIISNVPEVKGEDGKYSSKADKDFLYDVCEFEEDDVTSFFRAGKPVTDGGSSKTVHRPLIVKLCSREAAMHYCNNGKGWMVEDEHTKDKNGKAVRYWINQDLSRADREANFLVREERRKRLQEKAKVRC